MNHAWLIAIRNKTLLGLVLGVGLLGGISAVLAAEEGIGRVSNSTATLTSYLDYLEAPFSFMNWGLSINQRSTSFSKEPALAAGKVVRGTFLCGEAATNTISFIWEKAAGKLHLDLNRNGDLTDDPAGVFVSRGKREDSYQTFTNVHLRMTWPVASREVVMDLNFYGYSERLFCNAGLRSFWQGQVTLAGKEWQIGIVELPYERWGAFERQSLLLRSWAARTNPFQVGEDSGAVFSCPTNLFVEGRAYVLARSEVTEGGRTRMKLQFTEQQPALGELKVTGNFIQQLALDGGPYLVVANQPGSLVKVPAGTYTRVDVRMNSEGVTAHKKHAYNTKDKKVIVPEKGIGSLAAGGPLTNSVSMVRRGRMLALSYQLLGAGGEPYELDSQDRSKPPEFAVYHSGKKISSGKFEFG